MRLSFPSTGMSERLPGGHHKGGFTLIEMIGVLSIITILVATVAPRIFKSVSDSKVNSMAMATKNLETSIADYYKDMNQITAVNAAGDPVASDATGLLLPGLLTRSRDPATDNVKLLKRFNGPYLDKFQSDAPPIGGGMTLPYAASAAAGTALDAAEGVTWDLDGNGTHDLRGQTALFLLTTDVAQDDFDRLDQVLDQGMGATDAERRVRGRVKWDAMTRNMRVLLTFK